MQPEEVGKAGMGGGKEAGTRTRGGLSNVKHVHVGTERVNVGGYMYVCMCTSRERDEINKKKSYGDSWLGGGEWGQVLDMSVDVMST